MPETPTSREQKAAIRRLNAELGLVPRLGTKGLLLGGALAFILGVLGLALSAPIEPAVRVQGVVESVQITSARRSPMQSAWIAVGGSQWFLPVPDGTFCAAADRVALNRKRTLTGVRYDVIPGGCAHAR